MPARRVKDDKHLATPSKAVTNPGGTSSRRQVPIYAPISLGVFVCCLAVLILLITNAERLSRFGLLQQIYYLILVLMGLAAAGFLFGVLQSTATYTGKLWGGTLRLSGSLVGAALVVIGGYYFLPKATTFPFTVYVHGEGGPQDIVLRNSGRVVLKLGPAPQSEPIGENGQAFFPAVPSDFRGQQVQAWVESDTYASTGIAATIEGTSLELQVQKRIKHFKLGGNIFDSSGNPLSGVLVTLTTYGAKKLTNEEGRFDFDVVADEQQMVDIVAQKEGHQTKHLSPTLGDSELNFSLKRN